MVEFIKESYDVKRTISVANLRLLLDEIALRWSYWLDEDYSSDWGSEWDRVNGMLAATAILGIIPMWVKIEITKWLRVHRFVGNLPKTFHRLSPEKLDSKNPYDQERQFVYETLCDIYKISPKGRMAELQYLYPLEQESIHGY